MAEWEGCSWELGNGSGKGAPMKGAVWWKGVWLVWEGAGVRVWVREGWVGGGEPAGWRDGVVWWGWV